MMMASNCLMMMTMMMTTPPSPPAHAGWFDQNGSFLTFTVHKDFAIFNRLRLCMTCDL
jgi:hypothetical protein